MSRLTTYRSFKLRETRGIVRHVSRALTFIISLFLLTAPAGAHAAIPQSERNVLIAIYGSMNGDQWFYNTNWCAGTCPTSGEPVFNAVGTECTWAGVTCDASGAHVTNLTLDCVTGSIPSLYGLTELQTFNAPGCFGADRNYQLSGSIPDLTGLTALQDFFVADNLLTGSIPSLSGLTALQYFGVRNNSFTGELPDLTGLTSLGTFDASHNQLSGSIPAVSGFGSFLDFDVSYNQLTGSIPSLQATTLGAFIANHNNLSGQIPTLGGSSLTALDVGSNQLTGSIPEFAKSNLRWLDVSYNRLSGALPAPPSSWTSCNQPAFVCRAVICPNPLDLVDSPAWDAALGVTPWWATPHANNQCDDTFSDGFEGFLAPPGV